MYRVQGVRGFPARINGSSNLVLNNKRRLDLDDGDSVLLHVLVVGIASSPRWLCSLRNRLASLHCALTKIS